MARVKRGVNAKKRHKEILDQAKGYQGARSRVFRVAKQAVIKAAQYAYRDRKKRKIYFRGLWIQRINAAVRPYGFSYSTFIFAVKEANVALDRKMLAHLACHDPEAFKALVLFVKKAQ